jgi:tetratricopeptide (TPR) repeat protein
VQPAPTVSPTSAFLQKYALPLIILLTVIIYIGSVRNNKMQRQWDDLYNVTLNEDVHSFSLDNAKKWFTTHYVAMYCPVKEAFHAVEYSLYGAAPVGYHATSLLLHCINIVLVFLLLFHFTRSRTGALFAALLFAVHPMATESVVWVSTRGEELYTMFYLCALICYCRGQDRKVLSIKHLALTFMFFVLSGLSKVSGVTLPLMLLLIDWYKGRNLLSRRTIAEKIPFVAVAIVLGLVVISGRSDQLMEKEVIINQFKSINGYLYSLYSTSVYIFKFVLPINQSCFYPHPLNYYSTVLPPPSPYFAYPFVLLGVVLLIWRCKKQRRHLLFAFGFFLVAICVTLQVVPLAGSIANERYTYLPYVGFYFLIAHVYKQMQATRRKLLPTAHWVLFIVAAVFAFRANAMSKTWYDNLSLMLQYQKSYADYSDPYFRLAEEYADNGANFKRALKVAKEGINTKYKTEWIYAMAGKMAIHTNNTDEATAYLNIALAMDSNNPEACMNKAEIFLAQKQIDSAEFYLNKFTDETYKTFPLYYDDVAKGRAYVAYYRENYPVVLAELDNVLTKRPLTTKEHSWRFISADALGDKVLAINELDTLIRLFPSDYDLYLRRVDINLALDRPDEAQRDYQTLLQLAPDNERVNERVKALGRRLKTH